MKIALLTSMKYGLTQFIFRDLKALDTKGHELQLFTLHYTAGLYNPLPKWEVNRISPFRVALHTLELVLSRPLLFVRLLRTALATHSLVNLLVAVGFAKRMRDADLIFAYFGDHKLFVGYYCKHLTDLPLLVTVRAYELYRNPNPEMFVKSLAACDRVLTITEYNRNFLVNQCGVPANKIDIVRQIVDLTKFKYEPKIKILIVGFFAEKKGHEILFRAIKQLDRDDIELWVVGDMNPSVLRTDCRQLARDMGIEAKVAFFGVQSDVALRALYRECDIFCLPSRTDRLGDKEGFPNVIAEAMAFSKPVVSTYHAGIPEAIDALLVEENNAEALAEALSRACDSADLRRELGERNRQVVEEMFSPANNDLLEEILLRYARQPEEAAGTSLKPQYD